ncbi:hypothetical protein BH10BAC3_BH10BAC3_00970 [soil metagenome]
MWFLGNVNPFTIAVSSQLLYIVPVDFKDFSITQRHIKCNQIFQLSHVSK